MEGLFSLAKKNPFMNPFVKVDCEAKSHPVGALKTPVPGRTILAAASG